MHDLMRPSRRRRCNQVILGSSTARILCKALILRNTLASSTMIDFTYYCSFILLMYCIDGKSNETSLMVLTFLLSMSMIKGSTCQGHIVSYKSIHLGHLESLRILGHQHATCSLLSILSGKTTRPPFTRKIRSARHKHYSI